MKKVRAGREVVWERRWSVATWRLCLGGIGVKAANGPGGMYWLATDLGVEEGGERGEGADEVEAEGAELRECKV